MCCVFDCIALSPSLRFIIAKLVRSTVYENPKIPIDLKMFCFFLFRFSIRLKFSRGLIF